MANKTSHKKLQSKKSGVFIMYSGYAVNRIHMVLCKYIYIFIFIYLYIGGT